ncbi:DUF3857 domain-containing protein [Sphingomonas sp. 1P06PA]|uniref:DUF3857 domain-containing protein n=1 Tax=Sphingomonas sp. 1P06PA TaxID=554121 RepID=UPI0039A74606
MHRWLGLVALWLIAVAGSARAEDRIAVGAVPGWVVPVEAPAAKPDAAGLSLRLLDFQTRIDAQGTHYFGRQVLKLSSVAALQAAGTVIVPWQPQFGTATIHRVAILRDGKTIDVLKDGSGFSIIRRETGLESAQIDGLLTAVMQVPDLRVGDELEFAFTVNNLNPLLDGHVEAENLFIGGLTVGRLHLRYSWPASRHLRWRAGESLPKPRHLRPDGQEVLVFDVLDHKMPVVPPRAPTRFIDIGGVQVSDFADWQAVSTLLAPIYARAATITPGSALDSEVKRIAAATPDPIDRAGMALDLVQRQVRYFAKVDGLGGYQPQLAEAVWEARVGDCKGKTVLLVAILRALGIDAEPALVSVKRSDGVEKSLPMPARFDHVIVRAAIAGKTYWLDGTRLGDRDLARLELPAFRWALPLVPDKAVLVALPSLPPTEPDSEWRLDLDARKGIMVPAAANGTVILRGDPAATMRAALSLLEPGQRDEMLTKMWQERHDWVTIDKVTTADDPRTGDLVLGFTGSGKMDWNLTGADASHRYEANKARLGRDLAPERSDAASRAMPVVVDREYSMTHQTILLPKSVNPFTLRADAIDETIADIHYRRTVSLKDGRFDMTASTRSAAGEISFADAKAADEKSNAVFARQAFINLPFGYQATADERAMPAADSPLAGDAYAEAGRLWESGSKAAAVKRLDRLIAGGERSARALAMRGDFHRMNGTYDKANNDYDGALAIDRTFRPALAGKAWLLSEVQRDEDALILLDRLIVSQPEFVEAYMDRAATRARLGRYEGALSDHQIILARRPDSTASRIAEVTLLNELRRTDEAMARAEAFATAAPGNASALALYGNMLAIKKRPEEARQAIAKSIAIEPTSDAYIARLTYDLSSGGKGQLDDVLAVIRLDPGRHLPDAGLSPLAGDTAAKAAIVAAYATATRRADVDREAVAIARDNSLSVLGEPQPLLARYAARAAAMPADPTPRNDACWLRATLNIELDKALADCDAAIAISRSVAFLDSRGMVHLRRGDLTKAIADYDAALAQDPKEESSLYGRGLAWLRSGDAKRGRSDIDKAIAIRPRIADEFARYGLEP